MKHTKVKGQGRCHCGKKAYMIGVNWVCVTRIKILPLQEIKGKVHRIKYW